MPLLLYTPHITPRVEYISATLLKAMGLKDFRLITHIDEYKNAQASKINYSSTPLAENECWIAPVGLLIETSITPQSIECKTWNGLKTFFNTGKSDIPFDIFSASFYLLTRYEEYLPHKPDMYGRYAHENSIAFKEWFLQSPLINLWLEELKKRLQQKFPSLSFQTPSFQFIPTYDIDIAWSYKHKGSKRNLGAAFKSLLKGDLQSIKQRRSVLQNKTQDPFDSYEWMDKLHQKFSLQPVYFFLLAQRNKQYDKNILPSNHAFKALVRQHAKQYEIGIHPSWQSGDDSSLLLEEKKLLESIIKKSVTKSRKHYIRMTLPETYQQLIAAGITEDYSMGYGSINGFRASYALPYKWYDLKKEEITDLTIHPFCYMDANSFYEQHYTTKQAAEELQYYLDVTRKANGQLITIWHNHFLGTDKMFAGWREVYQNFIKELSNTK